MKISSVELVISAVRRSQYPEDKKKEFLLVGRSNVGKSTFINTMINRKNFARTSSKPGKTQTLNFYLVNEEFYYVDVPGYGFSLLNKQMHKKIGMMIEEYLEVRDNMDMVFMLIDFRHKPSSDDVMMYNFIKHYNIPVTIVATKYDKVNTKNREKNKKLIIETLGIKSEDLILFSPISKIGKEEVSEVIEKVLAQN